MGVEQVLSPHEAAALLAFADESEALSLKQIAERSGITIAQARSAVERLRLREALDQAAEHIYRTVTLTDQGRKSAQEKLPELRLWATLKEQGPLPIQALQTRDDMEQAEAGAAFGSLRKSGAVVVEEGQARLAEAADPGEFEARQQFLERLAAAGELPLESLPATERDWLNDRRLRPLLHINEIKTRDYRLTTTGVALRPQAEAVQDEISRLTPAMLQDGSWRGRRFRRYNIGLPPRLVAGYRNAYRRFLDQTRQTLLGLGFEEMRGSLVENEFWNMDALFMPQFHPAREIHDVYFIQDPTHAREVAEPYLSNVAAAHEGAAYGTRGWGYVFDRERARRLVLRSQGTALSARALTSQPNIPGKYFSMARCFRYDSVDATHAPDFIQIEGIVLSPAVTMRHLLGILMLFAREIAQAREIRAVPDYYPFTEPSVQVHMRHPALGWIELGGAGIFRPEVTLPLGIDVPVIAWGLGLDRMAIMALGKNDIRHLFTNNLTHGLADNREIGDQESVSDCS